MWRCILISEITILTGRGKQGQPEPVPQVQFRMGDVVSIVGPTGSGKTTLINDIALFADGQTPTGRKVLLDGQPPAPQYRDDPASNPVAIITQHTNFLSDLPVGEFLHIHAGIRHSDPTRSSDLVTQTLTFANELTGEPIGGHVRMTELSGGQTRALLIADAAVIGNAPIILLDEIENAGIHRTRALQLLRRHRRVFVFVTHDPYIALLSDTRIVMGQGMVTKVLRITDEERALSRKVQAADDLMAGLRDKIRLGDPLTRHELEAVA